MKVRVLKTSWERARGFMFRLRPPEPDEVYLFILPRPGRMEASIHMLFVFFPLGVVWLDEGGKVVDKVVAKPFHLLYAPRAPAAYFVEGHPSIVSRWQEGEVVNVLLPYLSSGGMDDICSKVGC